MASASDLEKVRTPAGRDVFVFRNDANQPAEEAERALVGLLPGGEFFGRPMMFFANLNGNAKLPPSIKGKLRELTEGFRENTAPIAVVCTNPIARLGLKALCVLAPHGGEIRVHESPEKALSWLDQVMGGAAAPVTP